MNCDQVFDILTRGPFPTGHRDDDAVEHHLACCHECRSLAHALRPATDLFHEALSAENAANLPGYTGNALTDQAGNLPQSVATMVAEASAEERVATIRRRKDRNSRPNQPWMAVALCCLAFVALAALGIGRNSDSAAQPQGDLPLQLTVNTHLSDEGLATLRELNLPAACFKPDVSHAGVAQVALNTHWHQCCTRCHVAGESNATSSDRVVTTMAKSCQACHGASTSREVSSLPQASEDDLLCYL